MDYYGSMTPPTRLRRLAAAASLLVFSLGSLAQGSGPAAPANAGSAGPEAAATEEPALKSAMTAELFYEVLLGELTSRDGDAGSAYSLLLDAARRTNDPRLYQRAIEIALQARAGPSALSAARAWKQAQPDSREARRFELQILIALGRIGETVEPLRAEVAATPKMDQVALMAVIARSYSRAADKKLAASVVEQALVDALKEPGTAGPAWTTVGRMRLLAGDNAGALQAAQSGAQADPTAQGPVALALDLIDPAQPQAEALVRRYLASPQATPEVQIAYARVLLEQRRTTDASAQLSALTAARPQLAEPWLLLGTLQAQARQDAQAERAIQRYLELAAAETDTDADERRRGQNQAYFLLSQIAERRRDFTAAENWLARVDSSESLVALQARRAQLLARQGRMAQARELVRGLPERNAEDKRQKLQAEVQLLRDAREYQAAYDVLAQALQATPDDTDLLYDQAMIAEKMNRTTEMERTLRRVIELKPDNQNAYNALGYSLADRNVRLDEARTLIRKAVELAPDDPFIADSLGWVEYRLGNVAEAARILDAAYKKRPDPEIGAHLGEVLWMLGDRDRAVSIWREAVLADADNDTLQETLKRLRVKL